MTLRGSMSHLRVTALFLLAVTVGPAPVKAETPALPFHIKQEQVSAVVIRFRVASTKVNSGWDEIVISGDGKVTLRTAATANATPRELVGKVDPSHVTRLLQLFRAEGIEGWQEEYRAKSSDFVAKVLTVEMKNVRLKQVAVAQTEFPEFARACGAIKLVASLARPEVLAGGFFQRI